MVPHSLTGPYTVCTMMLLACLGSAAPTFAADQARTAAQAEQGNDESRQKSEELQEVVVTGTHIRGVSPASPLNILTSTDIANSGLSTAGDALRSLPQSFAGGQQSTIGTNGFGSQNFSNLSKVIFENEDRYFFHT